MEATPALKESGLSYESMKEEGRTLGRGWRMTTLRLTVLAKETSGPGPERQVDVPTWLWTCSRGHRGLSGGRSQWVCRRGGRVQAGGGRVQAMYRRGPVVCPFKG